MNSTAATANARFATKPGPTRRAPHASSRSVAWAEIIALVIITAALIAALVITSDQAHANVPSKATRVESGQSLWTLADQHPVAGLTTEQTAELIANINHIEGGRVAAGETIRIPICADEHLALACR
jgi:hypothetical protein